MLKKLGKKRILIFLCLMLVFAGGIFFYRLQKTEAGSTEEVKLEKGQSFVYGKIASIYGNEITYYVTEEPEEKQEEQNDKAEKTESPSIPEGGFSGERSQMPWGNQGNNTLKEEETVTVQIPVGAKVTTRLGTETTFSRLAAEDCIALVMEKDGSEEVIVAVYIVG